MGEEEFEVEAIVGHKMECGKNKFLVKWKGYPTSENSWEPLQNLRNAWELIEEFHLAHPDAPEPTSMTNATVTDFKEAVPPN